MKTWLIPLAVFTLPLSAFAISTGESITVLNDNNNGSPLTVVSDSHGNAISNGWLTLGYINDWDGNAALTGQQIINGWNSLGSTVSLNTTTYAALGGSGFLASTDFTFDSNVEEQNVSSKKLIVLVGDGSDLPSATQIAAVSFSAESAITWSELLDGSLLALDWTSPSYNGYDVELTPEILFGTVDNGVLMLEAIPEPSLFGLLAGTLALAVAGTRRRRK